MVIGTRMASSSYSSAAIWLHWLIALAVIGQFVGMEYSEGLVRGDPLKGGIAMLHKSTGLTILMLTLVRLFIRMRRGGLPLPTHMAGWEMMLARATHIAFYVLLILIPLSGWIFGVTADRGLNWFGLFPIPPLPLGGIAKFAHEFHEYAAVSTMVLFALHVLGALKHHFLDRDDVLARMLPTISRGRQ